jgi:ACS family glucarate transporter-like MFS transporter
MPREWWRVRWGIFGCLFGFAIFGYVQRTGIAIAAARMVPELGLTQIELGGILNAFLISYTLLQLPGAMLGQWLGPRRTLGLVGIVSAAAACSTALVPAGEAGVAVLLFMLLARSVLGVAQAALFPVASGVIQTWFPVRAWGLAQGSIVTGLWVGAALTPPLIAWLMSHWGWREALVASSAPSLVLVLLWWGYACDRPDAHRSVRAEELAELAGISHGGAARQPRAVACVSARPACCAAHAVVFLMNYVFYLVTFWCFLYLVQERRFTLLEGGWLASLPFLCAAIAAAAGGRLCDALCLRYGVRRGIRIVPVVALPCAAAFLVITGSVTNAYLAVATLCLAFACTEVTEGTYWAATMRAAPRQVMPATALLNMGGNLGGVVATPTIAALSAAHRWTTVFALGAALAVLAAVVLSLVDVEPADSHQDGT